MDILMQIFRDYWELIFVLSLGWLIITRIELWRERHKL